MKLCFYCTSGRDFKTFGFKVIYNFNFKDYVVKVIEINTLKDLFYLSNMINFDLVLTDSSNVICYNKEAENYSVEFINIF